MAIILEGPDAAGKTTLARWLVDMGMEIVVTGGAPRSLEALIQHCHRQVNACEDRRNVIDRISPISHPIYNPAYRGNEMLAVYLGMMINRDDVVVVYCRPPTDALMKPEKHQWKDYDTEEDKQKILNNQMVYIDLYDEAFAAIPHVCYDYTIRDSDEMVELTAMLAASHKSDEVLQELKKLQEGLYACERKRRSAV